MPVKLLTSWVGLLVLTIVVTAPHARADDDCEIHQRPDISFIEFQSLNLQTRQPLTVKGKMNVPIEHSQKKKCLPPSGGRAAVLILHGSAGIDSRGDFYAQALNAAGIATLEIDMWEARGVADLSTRPSHPIFTYPDAFAALAFLSRQPGIDPARIGVMGFSWGGVVTMAAATQNYASQFGGSLRFKAHVAHYPVCYAYNNPYIPFSDFGRQAGNPLTGAPLLIQIGSNDDYDEGAARCVALKSALPEAEQQAVNVVAYEAAYHAWDRLQVSIRALDPFAHLGAGGEVRIVPNVDQAFQSRTKAVRFFRENL